MARYVLLAVSDDHLADELVEAVGRQGSFFFLGKDGHFRTANVPDDPNSASVFVRGMYQKPTKFCECTGVDKSFTRSKKYSWWVHSACGKPTELWARGEHFFYSLGTNLLPVSTNAPEWRGQGVHGHNWNPDTKQWEHHETGEPWDPMKKLAELRSQGGLP